MKTQTPIRSTTRSPLLRATQLNFRTTLNALQSPCSQLSASDYQLQSAAHHHCSPGSNSRPSSPNYFELMTKPVADARNADMQARDHWSPSFFLHNADMVSPKFIPLDASPGLEAFRKQMEANHGFNLSHSKLSLFTSSSVPVPRPIKHEKRTAKCDAAEMPSPKLRPPIRKTISTDVLANGARTEKNMPPSGMSHGLVDRKEEQTTNSPMTIHNQSPNLMAAKQAKIQNNFSSAPEEHPRPLPPRNEPIASSRHLPSQNKPSQASTDKILPKKDYDPAMITPAQVQEMMENLSESALLMLDLRVFPLFSQSHIKGALNLCIPTTLLKRPSFNLQKLMDTFSDENEKMKFSKWKVAKYIIVYDSSSSEKENVSALNTLKKFSMEGWNGDSFILQGGFQKFVNAYPDLVDGRLNEGTETSKINLSLGTKTGDISAVAGGCPMPAAKNAANPFFSNIRQNQDLIGGVGQIDIKLPERLTSASLKLLPRWLVNAIEAHDHGKQVSNKYLRLEQEELATMTKALSSGAANRSSTSDSKAIKLAGIEKGEKNRYNNIWPFEHSRVRLLGRPAGACDYVNASYIQAPRTNKRYIASQGPLPATFEDFWSVIWDQNVRVIVMLTAEVENGQLKCHSYWTPQRYGPLEVKVLSEEKVSLDSSYDRDYSRRRANTVIELTRFMREEAPPTNDTPHTIVRKLTLSHSACPSAPIREITQIQYSSWPDFGAPASASQVLGVVELTNIMQRAATTPADDPQLDELEDENSRPILVHCSAGCGRTGTFCTIDSVIDILKRQRQDMRSKSSAQGASTTSDVNGRVPSKSIEMDNTSLWDGDTDLVEQTVENFRSQRLSMVQNLRQFVLCYEAILEWIARQVNHGPKAPSVPVRALPHPVISFGGSRDSGGNRDRCGSVW